MRVAMNKEGAVTLLRPTGPLIADELEEGRLVQPFGPELEGKPFYLVYPENRRDDPVIRAIRDWVMEVPGGLCNGLERGADASEWFDSKSASPGTK